MRGGESCAAGVAIERSSDRLLSCFSHQEGRVHVAQQRQRLRCQDAGMCVGGACGVVSGSRVEGRSERR